MAKSLNLFPLCLVCSLAVLAPAAGNAQAAPSQPGAPPPVAYASVSELNTILTQIRQTAQNIEGDLGKTRIEKWKADSATKRDIQGNVESIQRNLQSALPEIITQLNNAPEDLAASFKLYRNLDALYDVFGPVVESAGAFGSKDEFQNLSNDMSSLQSARRALGERMQNLAAAKENELARLRNQLKTAQAAAPPAPPKKIIVDDTEPPKKPAKKKPAKPNASPAAANPQSAPQTK
ncbi:MAG: hypothetical protein HY233_11715 [Acidobacteriales bacterium]|nr:hypothetical protein [Candidatus Koribacter versatilis]MBI3646617.1 hypothetical protein [Terriglobales bacterium]